VKQITLTRPHPIRRLALTVGFFCCVALAGAARGAEWEATLSAPEAGPFRNLRPVTANYGFGWNGITAASVEVRLAPTADGHLQFTATGGTIGLARSLWEYEVNHSALVDAQTLRPLQVNEVENIRAERVTTELIFTPEGVTSAREERKDGQVKSKTRRFAFPNVLSVNAALLHLRTQPLPEGAIHRVVVYPATSAYLCTVKVVGRERVTVPTGTYDALKLDVKLNKIGKERELQPHKKLKKATVWLADDSDRLILRIEAQIFVGTVFAELQSVAYDEAKR